MDSNFWFRAEIRFGPGLLDRHRVPWPIASAATPGHHPARFPSLGARRRRPLPRPARPALAVALRSMLAETEAKVASVGPTAEEDIGPALAPHLAKPDRDVDPGSGTGGHGSAVGERPEPSTRINNRRTSSPGAHRPRDDCGIKPERAPAFPPYPRNGSNRHHQASGTRSNDKEAPETGRSRDPHQSEGRPKQEPPGASGSTDARA